jgi:hypothetical protein
MRTRYIAWVFVAMAYTHMPYVFAQTELAKRLLAPASEVPRVDSSNGFQRALRLVGKAAAGQGVEFGLVRKTYLTDPVKPTSVIFIARLTGLSPTIYSTIVERIAFRITSPRTQVPSCPISKRECCPVNPVIECVREYLERHQGSLETALRIGFLRDLIAIELQSTSAVHDLRHATQTLLENNTAYIAFDAPPGLEKRSLILEIQPDRLQTSMWLLSKLRTMTSPLEDIDRPVEAVWCRNGAISYGRVPANVKWGRLQSENKATFYSSSQALPAILVGRAQEGVYVALSAGYGNSDEIAVIDPVSDEMLKAAASCISADNSEFLASVLGDQNAARVFYLTVAAAGVATK